MIDTTGLAKSKETHVNNSIQEVSMDGPPQPKGRPLSHAVAAGVLSKSTNLGKRKPGDSDEEEKGNMLKKVNKHGSIMLGASLDSKPPPRVQIKIDQSHNLPFAANLINLEMMKEVYELVRNQELSIKVPNN